MLISFIFLLKFLWMQCLCIIYILRFCMGILLLLFLFPLSMSPFSSFPSAALLLPSFPSRSLNHKISTEQSQKNRMNCHEKRPSFVTVQRVFLEFHLRMGNSKIQGFSNRGPRKTKDLQMKDPKILTFSSLECQHWRVFESGTQKWDDFQFWDC